MRCALVGTKHEDRDDMQCQLCKVTDTNVTAVATCSNRCTVTAHPECFHRRQTFSQWRKKHYDRDNAESEVCLVVGCQGKCKVKAATRNERIRETHRVKDTSTSDLSLDDPTRPCCFIGHDGLPCRRAAVSNNACTRHARQAEVMCMMVKKHEETVATVPVVSQETPSEMKCVNNAEAQTNEEKKKGVSDASTQTVLTETADALRKEVDHMEYAAHFQALHITRLELQMENEREELDTERAVLRSATEEDKRTITLLTEEVERLRAENVTMKRREESLKAKCITSRDTQKREIVCKLQELLASM